MSSGYARPLLLSGRECTLDSDVPRLEMESTLPPLHPLITLRIVTWFTLRRLSKEQILSEPARWEFV